jgi:putative transposase
MLFKNDVFELDGVRMRLLHADVPANVAWCISLASPLAWPVSLSYAEVNSLTNAPDGEVAYKNHTNACLRKCDEAWSRLEPLLQKHGNELFDPSMRNFAIEEYAQEHKCSKGTLRKDLRRYWQRGQSKQALMPDYDKSGRRLVTSEGNDAAEITAGRGRPPKDGRAVFQMTSQDVALIKKVVEDGYLKNSNVTTVDAYTDLVRNHYRYEDGNEQLFANPPGSRPSLRQFRRVLQQQYDIEVRLRGREGNSDYEREHRKVLGTVLADCQGVGHYYEIDATIADVYLVSRQDPNKIIGKPTLYLIIDRKSRLIVGFYFGLENASWNAALQAILSISEEKRALCERYGVEYNPEDWPADKVFPREFLADRGDMISHASSSIAEGLQVTVTNLPGLRPDWKPLVECGFRLLHAALRPITPAYDPPSNASRRRGKRNEKDACLTVDDFGHLILTAIIQHNRRHILEYPLSPAELAANVDPSPIGLWSHDIVSRSGQLTRYTEEKVRFSLLRQEQATVTERGIEFRGCYYSLQLALTQKWFETARKRRFKVIVSYDPRLVDQVYVHALDGKGEPQTAELTARSRDYLGYSFEEVRYFELLRTEVLLQARHQRLENSVEFRDRMEPVIEQAKTRLKAVGGKARRARRADTKPARNEELAQERQEMAHLQTPLPEAAQDTQAIDNASAESTSTNRSERLAAVLARMRA